MLEREGRNVRKAQEIPKFRNLKRVMTRNKDHKKTVRLLNL